MKRIVNSPLFLVAAVCFFLPFITVACKFDFGAALPGAIPEECTKTTATGFHLVTADSPEIPQECLEGLDQPAPEIESGTEDQPGQAWAITAFAAAVAGVGLSLLRKPVGAFLAVALGVLGTVTLFVLRARATPELPPRAQGLIEVRTEYGFWLAVVFFLLAAGWGVFRLVSEGPLRARPPGSAVGFGAPEAPPPPPPTEPPPA